MPAKDTLRRRRNAKEIVFFIGACAVGMAGALFAAGGIYQWLSGYPQRTDDIVMLVVAGVCLLFSLGFIWEFLFPPFRRGRCPTCGYDLRATPNLTTEVLPACPECGAPTPRWTEYDE